MRFRRFALILVVVALLAPLVVQPRLASAHAVLERSSPEADQKLQDAPDLVETWYTEDLERSLTKLEVVDAQGNAVQTGETQFSDTDPTYASVALPADLGPGIYTVTFQNVSRTDGHPWSGFFTFIVLNPDGSVPAGQAHTPAGFTEGGGGQGFLPGIGDTTLRWFGLLAASVLAGSFIFYLLITRPAAHFLEERDREEIDEAALMTAVDLAVLALPVLAISLTGQILLLADRLGGADRIDDILFHTRTGSLWFARTGIGVVLFAMLLPIALGVIRPGRLRPLVGGVVALLSIGMIVTYSLGSHGAAGGGEFWSVTSDFAHFVAVAAWLGGLLQLALVFYWTVGRLRDSERLLYQANALDRFSWLAAISVVIIIGTGLFNTFVQIPVRDALWETTYGRVLIVKMALVLPLLGVAGLNALFLKPAIVRGIDELYGQPSGPEEGPPLVEGEPRPVSGGASMAPDAGLERLRWLLPRTTALEFVLAAAVLVATAVLTQSTTAKGELAQEASGTRQPFSFAQTADDLSIRLTIAPFDIGVNTFTVKVDPAQEGGNVGEVLQVRLQATPYDLDTLSTPLSAGSDTVEMKAGEDNTYTLQSAMYNQAAHWRTIVEVRRRGVDDTRTSFGVHLVDPNAAKPGFFELPFDFVNWNIVAGGGLLVLGLGLVLVWRSRPPTWQPSTAMSVGVFGGVLLMAGAVLVFGVDVHQGSFTKNPIKRTEESIAQGKSIYEMNCAVCHGPGGKGDGPNAASLPVRPADLTYHVPNHPDGTLFKVITLGVAGVNQQNMPSFESTLTEDQRWNLINYLRATFGENTGTGDFVAPTGNSATPSPGTTPGAGTTATPVATATPGQ